MRSLPLDFFHPPLLGRAGFEQTIINKDPLVVNDDVVSQLPLLGSATAGQCQ